jgi:hypothetical protein
VIDRDGASDILPTVIMEAMASGLPVVSTRLVGVPEMVVDRETGVLVPPDTVAELAEALAGLAQDRALGKTLGENGRERVAERFDAAQNALQLAEKFSRLPGTTPSKPGTAAASISTTVRLIPAFPYGLKGLKPGGARLLSPGSAPDWNGKEVLELLDQVDFLPDATYGESLWQQDTAWRQTADKLRCQLGTAVEGERFYQQARRALVTADLMRRRGLTRVESSHGATVLWAWLSAKAANCPATFIPAPGEMAPKTLWKKIGADFGA